MFKNQCYSNSAFGIVGFHSAVVVKPGILADTGAALFKDLSAVLLCWVGLVGVSCPLVLPHPVCFFKTGALGYTTVSWLWKRKQSVGQVSTEFSVQKVSGNLMEARLLMYDSRRSKLP